MQDQYWVSVAIAHSGPWHADLDRSNDGMWHLIVERQPVYLCIDINDPSAITAALGFLKETSGKRQYSEFEFGRCLGSPVILVKDDEFPDRYFVKMCAAETVCQFTLVDEDVSHLRNLLEGLKASAAGDGRY